MFNIYLVKYLNTFDKLFESSQCLDDLRDIALDIEDDDFEVQVTTKTWVIDQKRAHGLRKIFRDFGITPKEVSVYISLGFLTSFHGSDIKEFYICDISQCVQRMVDYMRSEGYFAEMYVLIVKDLPVGDQRSYLAWNDVVVPLDRNCLGGRKIKYLDITFKKVEI